MLPAIFVSHGAPNTILKDVKTKINFQNLAKSIEKPKYIVMVSAHWYTQGLRIINPCANNLLYDFYGFEKELYEIKYPIKSDENYTKELLEVLKDLNIAIDISRKTFDHGVWTPLYMMYEELDVPVIQISLPMNYSALQLINLGEKLQKIRNEALIITSGSLTHNLYNVSFNENESPDITVKRFEDEISHILKNGETEKLINFRNIENFSNMHPTYEHFIPLLVAYGSSIDKIGIPFNDEILNRTLSMQSYIFKG